MLTCTVNSRIGIAGVAILLIAALFLTGCTDDSDGSSGDTESYEDLVDGAYGQYCRCYSDALGHGSTEACLEERSPSVELSSCQRDVRLCFASDFGDWRQCQKEAMGEFETCLAGCPDEAGAREACDEQLATALNTCDEQRTEDLVAGFKACAESDPTPCSPGLPGDAGIGDTGDEDAGDDQDAGDDPDAGDEQDVGDEDDAGNEDVDAGPSCGNGVVDGSEECEPGLNPDGVSCIDLGFSGGTPVCDDNCTWNTSVCWLCGDGTKDPNESCDDGADNGSYGACLSDCSGRGPRCGDELINGPEACDGTNLASQTCASRGYHSGTLACGADCTFDEGGCTNCGNGQIDGDETCDDGADNGTYGNCNATCDGQSPFCGDGVINGPEECDGTQLGGATCDQLGFTGTDGVSCSSSCTLDTSGCGPGVGDIIFTEWMGNPSEVSDSQGEWFEILNTTSSDLELEGCKFISATSGSPAEYELDTSHIVQSGEYYTFARSTTPGFVPDATYSGLIFNNTGIDDLSLECPTANGDFIELDRLVWSEDYDEDMLPPVYSGTANALDGDHLTATENDERDNWCPFYIPRYNGTDTGTPGDPNWDCDDTPGGP